jgi:thiopeptide-type bacteriocin biosynthesis protein
MHVFADEHLDSLLVGWCRPLVQELVRREVITGFFLIRYWNGGPHVRLRLAASDVDHPALADEARAMLERHLAGRAGMGFCAELSPKAYTEQAAEMARAESAVAGLNLSVEAVEPLQQPRTLQVRKYQFNAQRYGGEAARSTVEEHFQRSSQLALRLLFHTADRMAERRTMALHLAAATAASLDLPAPRVADLFTRLSDAVHLFSPPRGDDAGRDWREAEFVEVPIELVDQLRHGPSGTGQDATAVRVLEYWTDELIARRRQLADIYREYGVRLVPEYVALDFLHLLNNRLGIEVADECYLYRLVATALGRVGPG